MLDGCYFNAQYALKRGLAGSHATRDMESGEYNAGSALYSRPGSTTASKFEIYGFAAFEAESLLFNAYYALNAIDHRILRDIRYWNAAAFNAKDAL